MALAITAASAAFTPAKGAVVCDECRKPTLANKACDEYSPAHDQSIEKHPSASCIKVQRDAAHFDCNICLDGCHDPVVTHCGHLFCWPCLYSWLSLPSVSKECPICRANVQDKIVPLYGGGGGGAQQSTNSAATMFPGMHIPSRPLPSRSSHVPVAANAVTHHDDDDERDQVAIQDYEIHTSTSARHAAANVGFLASMLRCGMTSLAAYSGGFLCDDQRAQGQAPRIGASTVAPRQRQRQRQRFSNEKEFLLHWAFIFGASIAIVCFFLS